MQSVCYVITQDHPLQWLYEHMNAVFILIEFDNKKISETNKQDFVDLGTKTVPLKPFKTQISKLRAFENTFYPEHMKTNLVVHID